MITRRFEMKYTPDGGLRRPSRSGFRAGFKGFLFAVFCVGIVALGYRDSELFAWFILILGVPFALIFGLLVGAFSAHQGRRMEARQEQQNPNPKDESGDRRTDEKLRANSNIPKVKR